MKALAQRAIRLGVNPTYIEETWKRRFIKSWSISNFFLFRPSCSDRLVHFWRTSLGSTDEQTDSLSL